MISTEEIAYAPGQSLSVMVKPVDTQWDSFCSSLCSQQTDAFHLVDLGRLLHSHQLWMKHMPHIRPYYGEDNGTMLYIYNIYGYTQVNWLHCIIVNNCMLVLSDPPPDA